MSYICSNPKGCKSDKCGHRAKVEEIAKRVLDDQKYADYLASISERCGQVPPDMLY